MLASPDTVEDLRPPLALKSQEIEDLLYAYIFRASCLGVLARETLHTPDRLRALTPPEILASNEAPSFKRFRLGPCADVHSFRRCIGALCERDNETIAEDVEDE